MSPNSDIYDEHWLTISCLLWFIFRTVMSVAWNAPTCDWLILVAPPSTMNITVRLCPPDIIGHRRLFWSLDGHNRAMFGPSGKHSYNFNFSHRQFHSLDLFFFLTFQMHHVRTVLGNHTFPDAWQSWTFGYDGTHLGHHPISHGSVIHCFLRLTYGSHKSSIAIFDFVYLFIIILQDIQFFNFSSAL